MGPCLIYAAATATNAVSASTGRLCGGLAIRLFTVCLSIVYRPLAVILAKSVRGQSKQKVSIYSIIYFRFVVAPHKLQRQIEFFLEGEPMLTLPTQQSLSSKTAASTRTVLCGCRWLRQWHFAALLHLPV